MSRKKDRLSAMGRRATWTMLLSAQVHGAAVGLKTAAFARRARDLAQEVPVPLAGTRVLVEGRQDSGVAEAEVFYGQLLLGRAVKQGASGLGRERSIRRVQAEAQGIPRDGEQAVKRRGLAPAPKRGWLPRAR